MSDTSHLRERIEMFNSFAAEERRGDEAMGRTALNDAMTSLFDRFGEEDYSSIALAMARYGSDDLRAVLSLRGDKLLKFEYRNYVYNSLDWEKVLEDAGDQSFRKFIGVSNIVSPAGPSRPIVAAILKRRSDALELFLSSGANPNEYPYLHSLATRDDDESFAMFQMLLRAGANPFIVDAEGNSILHIAAENKNPRVTREVLRYLESNPEIPRDKILSLINSKNVEGETVLFCAVCEGDSESMEELLLRDRSSIDDLYDDLTLLLTAIKLRENRVVEVLLDNGANPDLDVDGIPPIIVASAFAGKEMAALLARKGANLNVQYGKYRVTPLDTAIIDDDEDLVEVFLQNGADPNFNHCLIQCVSRQKFNMAKLLIRYGARCDVEDENGFNIYELMALTDEGKETLREIEIFASDEDLEFFAKSCRTRVMLGLTYSNDDFAVISPAGNKMAGGIGESSVHDFLILEESSKIDFTAKEKFLEILRGVIEERRIRVSKSSEVSVFKLPYDDHKAYAIIDYVNGKAKNISFCDGNFPAFDEFSCGCGELTFEIDQDKLGDKSPEALVVNSFSHRKNKIFEGDRFDLFQFQKAVANIAVCDELGCPDAIDSNVPTKAQNRGNCGIKSLNLMLRSVLRRMDRTLTFHVDAEGNHVGGGDEVYREYKRKLIGSNLETLISLTDIRHAGKPTYPKVMESLVDVYLKAKSKGDEDLMRIISPVFEREGIDISVAEEERAKPAATTTGAGARALYREDEVIALR